MKTPKRDYKAPNAPQRSDIIDCTLESWKSLKDARWKRKNRVAQLKRTISRLNAAFAAERKQLNALWRGDHLKRFSPEWVAFIKLRCLKTPAEDATADEKFEYWVALREVGKSVLNAACLAAMAYGEAKGKGEE